MCCRLNVISSMSSFIVKLKFYVSWVVIFIFEKCIFVFVIIDNECIIEWYGGSLSDLN